MQKARSGNLNLKFKNGFDGLIPNTNRIIDGLLSEIEGVICLMILPLLRLLWILNTESEPPGYTHLGVGDKVWRGLGVVCQVGRLDVGFDGGKIARLPSNESAVLLFHTLASAKDNGLRTLELAHHNLVEFGL